ncbi:TetR/AcrR family transcriptional regulator [Streptomyces sp. NPDC053493]|uniref:TetR/AcrR family transcriptional regulator n=1 Tax=Streptomyces sp. NPDC053493 TaxID=3365705 RepID=UPI0037CE81F3
MTSEPSAAREDTPTGGPKDGPSAKAGPGLTGSSEDGLRDRLVKAGVELVDAEGVQALSLREIARRAGVSHGAPRRHFPTHLDLLSAIAREGFRELAERIAASEATGTATGAGTDTGTGTVTGADTAFATGAGTDLAVHRPRARIEALARAYLDFARARGGMYELMFRHDLLESGRLGLRDTSLPLFARLADLVALARPGAGEPATLAGALWANLHGLAQLWRWGSLRLATGADDLEPLLAAVLDAHLGPSEAGR